MTENDMTAALFAYIRKEEPDAFAWKIHDDYTGGIPDGMLDIGGGHVWMEAKKLRSRKANPIDMLSELQRKTIRKLVRLGQTVYVVGYVENWRTVKVYEIDYESKATNAPMLPLPHVDDVIDPPTDRRRVHPVLQLLRWRKDAATSATVAPAA